jgi:exosome complex RNA-binding protein Csl4
MINLKLTALLTAVALGAVSPALSHHSHAMFDHEKEVTVTGTVMEFAFRNPHVLLYLDISGDNGERVKYEIEMSNISNTVRRGIRPATFKPGDVVTAKVHPLKDGRPGGNYVTILAADGKTYD